MFPFSMNWQSTPGGTLFTVAMVMMTILNFCMAVFWIFVGWRAMRAHERLPDALTASLRKPDAKPVTGSVD